MTYYCNLCDKTIILKTKHKLFNNRNHKQLEDSFIMRYIVENPIINRINERLKKNICIHEEKYAIYQVCCVLKVNDDHHHRCRPAFNLGYMRNPEIYIKLHLPFSQLNEMRITFISSNEMMT